MLTGRSFPRLLKLVSRCAPGSPREQFLQPMWALRVAVQCVAIES